MSGYHIVKGGGRMIGSGVKSIYRAINPAPIPAVAPVLDVPLASEDVSIRSSSTSHDDPLPPPRKAAPVHRRPAVHRQVQV